MFKNLTGGAQRSAAHLAEPVRAKEKKKKRQGTGWRLAGSGGLTGGDSRRLWWQGGEGEGAGWLKAQVNAISNAQIEEIDFIARNTINPGWKVKGHLLPK